jgi:hypothetical protein
MTIAANRIEFFATELAKLGAKVTDETDTDGRRTVTVNGPSIFDTDSVHVSFTPGAAKGKGGRDSLFCMIFSTRKFPRKGYGVVEYHEAMSAARMLRDWRTHAHCEPNFHVCEA